MERIVKHITDRLVDQLPDDEEAYTLNDLRQHGFPGFVIKRIELELERNLSESIILPETEWAHMDSNEVRQAWEQFVSAIRSQARLPKSYTYAVVETAISDIIDILVQPRKNLPDIIFGVSDTLEYDELVERMDAIVVYRHFASLIPRYMEKREYGELSKKQCEKIIAQADEKLTSHYTPLNWAQMLEPLFLLMKEKIDSNLLRLFFQDKNKPRVARRFDLINKALNRSEFIEELSTPDLPDEDEQNELFRQYPQSNRSTGWEGLDKPAENASTPESNDEQQDDQSQQLNEMNGKEEANLNTLYSEETEEDESAAEELEAEEDDRDASLNAVFEEASDEDEHDEPELIGSEQEDHDRHKEPEIIDESNDEIAEDVSQDQEQPIEEDEEANIEIELDDEPPDHQPMWQRFLSPEEEDQWKQSDYRADDEVYEFEDSEDEELPDEDKAEEYDEEPLIDLTSNQEPNEKVHERLHQLLDDDRERFVEEIFRGGDEAYEEAVKKIAAKQDWRSASQFIEKEVFKRNLVDMYSEAAVDFTDRLHSYFMETTKS